MLSVRDLSFSYGDRKILDDVSFDAESNSIISILGPNGVGKTTMLKCICNLHKAQSGSVEIDGVNVTSLSGRNLAKTIGYVPQSTPATGTSVFDAALIGRRPHIEWGVTKKDLEITWATLKSLKIDHLAMKPCNAISGGEYQKVQIARAIIQEPKILIMDEPTNNLDIANQHVTMHTIINAAISRGLCTIMTMHDINLAVHYSDKLLFVKDGKVAAYGGREVVEADLIKEVYGIDADVIEHKGAPFVIPRIPRGDEDFFSHTHPHDRGHGHPLHDHHHHD